MIKRRVETDFRLFCTHLTLEYKTENKKWDESESKVVGSSMIQGQARGCGHTTHFLPLPWDLLFQEPW